MKTRGSRTIKSDNVHVAFDNDLTELVVRGREFNVKLGELHNQPPLKRGREKKRG